MYLQVHRQAKNNKMRPCTRSTAIGAKAPPPRLPWHLHGERSDLELCKAHSAGIVEIFSSAKWATGHTKGQTDNNPCLLARKEFLSTFPWTWANGIIFPQMLRQLTGLLSCNLTSNWKIPRPSRKQMANGFTLFHVFLSKLIAIWIIITGKGWKMPPQRNNPQRDHELSRPTILLGPINACRHLLKCLGCPSHHW